MLRQRVVMVACLAGLVAASAAGAAEEPQFQPGLRLEIPFGGAAPAGGAELTARLDYGTGDGRRPAGPVLLQWRVGATRNTVELVGLPLVAGAGYRLDADEASTGGKVATAVGIGAGATVFIGGLALWALIEGLESFGDALGEGFGEAVADGFTPGDDEGGDGATPDAPCSGVQVGDECITTGGG